MIESFLTALPNVEVEVQVDVTTAVGRFALF